MTRTRTSTNSSADSERTPLLHDSDSFSGGAAKDREALLGVTESSDTSSGEREESPATKDVGRQIGITSAIFLIFNRIAGSGIYATPAVILQSSGSVGMSLVLWLIGAFVAAAGTAVYVELGTGLPRSGGEKNYLEYIYRKPRYLVSCIYAVIFVFFAGSTANGTVFCEYISHALSLPPPSSSSPSSLSPSLTTKLLTLLPIFFASLIHTTAPVWGIRIQNTIGFFKLFLLLSIPVLGVMSLFGLEGEVDVGGGKNFFRQDMGGGNYSVVDGGGGTTERYRRGQNFDLDKVWKGTITDPTTLVTAFFGVMWSFIGYSNANYALSESRNPVRVLRVAAPLGVAVTALVFLLVNLAYFLVVPKEEILGGRGGGVIASLFFRSLFGPATDRILSACIAISTLGNIMVVTFANGRVFQELGRQNILPFSSLFASNKPFGTPLAGLVWPLLNSTMVVWMVPGGDVFRVMLNLSSYTHSIINGSVALGLVFLHSSWARPDPDPKKNRKGWAWNPPVKAWPPAIYAFILTSLILLVVPLIPPAPNKGGGGGGGVYDGLPYYTHVIASLGVIALGMIYWFVWWVWVPRVRAREEARSGIDEIRARAREGRVER